MTASTPLHILLMLFSNLNKKYQVPMPYQFVNPFKFGMNQNPFSMLNENEGKLDDIPSLQIEIIQKMEDSSISQLKEEIEKLKFDVENLKIMGKNVQTTEGNQGNNTLKMKEDNSLNEENKTEFRNFEEEESSFGKKQKVLDEGKEKKIQKKVAQNNVFSFLNEVKRKILDRVRNHLQQPKGKQWLENKMSSGTELYKTNKVKWGDTGIGNAQVDNLYLLDKKIENDEEQSKFSEEKEKLEEEKIKLEEERLKVEDKKKEIDEEKERLDTAKRAMEEENRRVESNERNAVVNKNMGMKEQETEDEENSMLHKEKKEWEEAMRIYMKEKSQDIEKEKLDENKRLLEEKQKLEEEKQKLEDERRKFMEERRKFEGNIPVSRNGMNPGNTEGETSPINEADLNKDEDAVRKLEKEKDQKRRAFESAKKYVKVIEIGLHKKREEIKLLENKLKADQRREGELTDDEKEKRLRLEEKVRRDKDMIDKSEMQLQEVKAKLVEMHAQFNEKAV